MDQRVDRTNRTLTDFTAFVGIGQTFVRFLGLFGSRGRRDGADDGGGFERVRSGKRRNVMVLEERRRWMMKDG